MTVDRLAINEQRAHNSRLGMDERLRIVVDARHVAPVSDEDRRYAGRAAEHYRTALRRIRTLRHAGACPQEMVTVAEQTLQTVPEDGPCMLDRPHHTLRMCQWMIADDFNQLAWIREGRDHPEHADALIDRALEVTFVPMGLR